MPLFPFNLLNYALGLTQIPLAHYVLASFVCMAPGALAYTWLGLCRAGSARREPIDHQLRSDRACSFSPRSRSCRDSFAARAAAGNPSGSRWKSLQAGLETAPTSAVIDVRGRDEFRGPLGHIAGALNLPVGEAVQIA